MTLHPGQIVHIHSTPVMLIGSVQLNEHGVQREYAIVQFTGGTFVRSGLHVSKFLVPIGNLDEVRTTNVEVVNE